ncbi:MAG: ABC transporter substrate-binding protein [Methanophagales archaeon]|nr:ABC transporter substrate-binding protein [Methanophagales archaeon]
MKTKNVVLVGIAVCAISLLLISPVLANEDDFVLDIYGNANEDDTIDGQDVVYIKLIIFGKRDVTQLADACYDEEIDVGDIIQTKLIILGREGKLTIIDGTDRTVTLNMPIDRIASSSMPQDIRRICALGAADKIVGVPDVIIDEADRFPAIYMPYPELLELPIAGSVYFGGPYLEVIASLEPDLVIVSYADADAVQEAVGVPTITTPAMDMKALAFKGFKWFRMMGYVLGEQERAEELNSYFNDKLDEVRDVTSEIDDKPGVYLAFWTDYTYTPATYAPVEVAGGINVAEDPGTYGPYGPFMWQVSKEQIIAWQPDIILIHSYVPTKHMILKEDILTDPDLQSIPAVDTGEVYYTKGFQFGWDPATGVIECFYMAKLFHSDEFAGVDIEEVGNEILEEVYGADGIWTEMTALFELYTW